LKKTITNTMNSVSEIEN